MVKNCGISSSGGGKRQRVFGGNTCRDARLADSQGWQQCQNHFIVHKLRASAILLNYYETILLIILLHRDYWGVSELYTHVDHVHLCIFTHEDHVYLCIFGAHGYTRAYLYFGLHSCLLGKWVNAFKGLRWPS